MIYEVWTDNRVGRYSARMMFSPDKAAAVEYAAARVKAAKQFGDWSEEWFVIEREHLNRRGYYDWREFRSIRKWAEKIDAGIGAVIVVQGYRE